MEEAIKGVIKAAMVATRKTAFLVDSSITASLFIPVQIPWKDFAS